MFTEKQSSVANRNSVRMVINAGEMTSEYGAGAAEPKSNWLGMKPGHSTPHGTKANVEDPFVNVGLQEFYSERFGCWIQCCHPFGMHS